MKIFVCVCFVIQRKWTTLEKPSHRWANNEPTQITQFMLHTQRQRHCIVYFSSNWMSDKVLYVDRCWLSTINLDRFFFYYFRLRIVQVTHMNNWRSIECDSECGEGERMIRSMAFFPLMQFILDLFWGISWLARKKRDNIGLRTIEVQILYACDTTRNKKTKWANN